MTSRIRHIISWSILPVLILAGVSSCKKAFSVTDYQMNILSVRPGAWEDGEITRYPSVDLRVDGPDTQNWEIIISPANGASPYSEMAVTGRIKTIVLEGIGLSKEKREMGITIRAVHVNTGETLATNNQYKASIEGNFDPVVPPSEQETISVTALSLVSGEESSPITVTGGHKASLDVMEGYSGSLVLSYSQAESETEAISCTLSQTEGKDFIILSQEKVIRGESAFTIPFTAGKPGTGSFSITLKGKGPETVFTVSYIVKSLPHEATLTPNRFLFAEQYDAHGTVEVFGFQEGDRCDVILHWKETTTGEEGSTTYPDVDAKSPLDVVLWKAGEAAVGKEYIFWAEVFEKGKTEPAAITEKKTVTPFSIGLSWTDARGDLVSDGKVRSWSSSSKCVLGVKTAPWATEFITKVSLKDITTEKTYSTKEVASQENGLYNIRMTHPIRGEHQLTVTLQTTEGDFTFDTGITFIDVWTFTPYVKGSSLFADFRGPTSSISIDCSLTVLFKVYAAWDYTVAETNSEGQQVNTPKQAINYVRNKGVDHTVPAGTSSGTVIKFQEVAGLFNVALNLLKPMGRDKPFSETGLTATRWEGGSIVTYTPPASKTMVSFSVTVAESFLNDYNEVLPDISQLKSLLEENDILYLP